MESAGNPNWPDGPVRRRRVIVFHGINPATFENFFRPRLGREFGRYAEIRQLDFQLGPYARVDDNPYVLSQTLSLGDGAGNVETDYVVCTWDDVIRAEIEQPLPHYVVGGLHTFFRYLFSGAVFRIFKGYFRFGLIWLFPFAVILFAVLAALAGGFAAATLIDGWQGFVAGILIALLVIPAVILGVEQIANARWIGSGWIWTDKAGVGHRPTEERIRAIVPTLAGLLDRNDVDETVLVGHSSGVILLVSALADVIARRGSEPFPRPAYLMTPGSGLPLACHPGHVHIREAVSTVVSCGFLDWVDVQSRHDAMNIYKASVLDVLGIGKLPRNKPRVLIAQIKRMIRPEQYRRIRRDQMRVHIQTLLANDLPYWYDYCLFVAGRERFPDRVDRGEFFNR
ncbi:MAG: hypothetical protein KDJ53_07735 [Rhodobiaceae bacterium]|nr:hypothetical protein [Rhodobiaceae bacterium]